ncbi:serine/threonine protein kinase [Kibdelosporangium philippinense]|uniref:non-specific serine/threonine protein kinase n=1 Tax=Kibdelosporangium philippinense TaxID=211113 RepID=A0ABS8ZM78_9PSEU|nr:serine/threonine-protein kinase [Kibdelosporangium philippinense]MCE7007563.1 serine/threonine protein kinase [Kibdelosporangium philippinense]
MSQEFTQRIVSGRYQIVHEIGRGGMGIVWLAEDRTIGRRVAIKELHLPDGIDPQERHIYEERVLREARIAGRLNDPAIVTVYDVVQEHGNTFIVMELIEAPTLADIVRQRGALSEAYTAQIAQQLVSALEAAHRAGVVHRDVKPSNVMIDANGRVKLTDFGIAQSTDDPRLTTSGTLIGSPTYMSPERLQGHEAVPASDLWGLGATLFFAVEGYGAYERTTTAASIQAIMNEVAYLTRCRGPLASLIMGLLNSNPDGRPTAPQVRALLGQATQVAMNTGPTAPVWTQQPTSTQTSKPPKGRRALAIGLVVVLAAAMLAAGWFGRDLFGTAAASGGELQPTLTYGVGGNIPVFDVYFNRGKSCLDARPADKVQYDAVVDCAKEEHQAEVFMEYKTLMKIAEKEKNTPAAAYPADNALDRYAESSCSMFYNSNEVLKNKAMNVMAVIPSKQAWEAEKAPQRSIYCIAWPADNSAMTGSIVPDETS